MDTMRSSQKARGRRLLPSVAAGALLALAVVLLSAFAARAARTGAGAPAGRRANRSSAAARAIAKRSSRRRVSAQGPRASIALSATPGTPRANQTVRFALTVHVAAATGALERSLTYGDGTGAPPIAVPQYCLAIPGRAASETWRFSHSYRKPGTYDVVASAGSNCGGGHASVRMRLRVR